MLHRKAGIEECRCDLIGRHGNLRLQEQNHHDRTLHPNFISVQHVDNSRRSSLGNGTVAYGAEISGTSSQGNEEETDRVSE